MMKNLYNLQTAKIYRSIIIFNYMKTQTNIVFTILNFIVLSALLSVIHSESVNAQSNDDPTDPKQVLKEFKTGKDTIQKDLQINFDQLINVIKQQLDFTSVDSHLSLASQHFINGKVSEGMSELEKANKEWQNSSMTIMNTGNEFVAIANNNSTSMSDDTKEILHKLGNILVNMGTKLENLRIQLNN